MKVINPLLIELRQLEKKKSVCFVVIISSQLVTSFGLLHLDDVAPGSFQLAHLFVLLLASDALLRWVIKSVLIIPSFYGYATGLLEHKIVMVISILVCKFILLEFTDIGLCMKSDVTCKTRSLLFTAAWMQGNSPTNFFIGSTTVF